MLLFLQFLLTMASGSVVGYVFFKLKIPGGVLVGSIVGVAILNIGFSVAFVPAQAKVLAQLTAGAFIGSSVNKKDLLRLRTIYKPAAILMSLYFALNIILGFSIYKLTSLDLATSLFSAVPGGISDITLIATDMGADAPKVAMMQFIRLILGVGFFPTMISAVCKSESQNQSQIEEIAANTIEMQKEEKSIFVFLVTITTAIIFGVLGSVLKIPAGALLFSLISVIVLKFIWGKMYFPMWLRRVAQLLSGSYIACSIGVQDLIELKYLLVPAIILIAGYSVNCFFTGWVLQRFCGFSCKESMLAATPAGASDMVLISIDMGVQSTDLIALHVLRLLTVSIIFPQILHLILILS